MNIAKDAQQPAEDGGRGAPVELLVDDCLEQRLEGRMRTLHRQGKGASQGNQLTQFRVGLAELLTGLSGVVANGAAAISHRAASLKETRAMRIFARSSRQ